MVASLAYLLIQNSNKLKNINKRAIRKAKVVEEKKRGAIVNFGGKQWTFIKQQEFKNFNFKPKKGDFIQVAVTRKKNPFVDPFSVVSFENAKFILNWTLIKNCYKEGDLLVGTVQDVVKGGLIVNVGVKVFLPISQLDVNIVQQLSLFNYVGKTFKFKILKINKVRRGIIISRRNLLEFEKKIFKEKLLKRLKIGTLCYGYIKNITNYGIFVDINGIDGLLHFTDISWGRTSRKVKFHVGVKIKVLIIGIDVLKERISLGLKHLLKNPWSSLEKSLTAGILTTGKVISVIYYGIFVELMYGVEGLIHNSELINYTCDSVKTSIQFKVDRKKKIILLNVDTKEQKIALSLITKFRWNFYENFYNKLILCFQMNLLKKLYFTDRNFTEDQNFNICIYTPQFKHIVNGKFVNFNSCTGSKITARDFDLKNKLLLLSFKEKLMYDKNLSNTAIIKIKKPYGLIAKVEQFNNFFNLILLPKKHLKSINFNLKINEIVKVKLIWLDNLSKRTIWAVDFTTTTTPSYKSSLMSVNNSILNYESVYNNL